jgi:hypothetical protein
LRRAGFSCAGGRSVAASFLGRPLGGFGAGASVSSFRGRPAPADGRSAGACVKAVQSTPSLTKLELVEVETGVFEQRNADTYHVHFDRTLGDSCDCKGFVAHRHCKHRDALAELRGRGLL